MNQTSAPPEIGKPPTSRRIRWVQTERSSHEAWGRLVQTKPAAAALLHHLTAKMGDQNAVVISQKVLGDLMGVTDRTVRTAVGELVAGRWIQVVRVGKGREAAYVINDRVAWGESRDKLSLSLFSATIVADARDQDAATLAGAPLVKVPVLVPRARRASRPDAGQANLELDPPQSLAA